MLAAGGLTVSENEAAIVPATLPYAVTVANAATFADDLGVYYAAGASAGNRFSRVGTPSSPGQYSVKNTGDRHLYLRGGRRRRLGGHQLSFQ